MTEPRRLIYSRKLPILSLLGSGIKVSSTPLFPSSALARHQIHLWTGTLAPPLKVVSMVVLYPTQEALFLAARVPSVSLHNIMTKGKAFLIAAQISWHTLEVPRQIGIDMPN